MYELIGVVILVHSSRRLNPTSKGRDLIDICTDSERELTASVLKKKKKDPRPSSFHVWAVPCPVPPASFLASNGQKIIWFNCLLLYCFT